MFRLNSGPAHIVLCGLCMLLIQTVVDAAEQVSPIIEPERVEGEKRYSFPDGDLFTPLIAATRQPQFFITFAHVDSEGEDFLGASVGFGHIFGLYRSEGEVPSDGWQLSFFGAVFSQFNMDAPSHDLINTDFQVGFPLSYRHGSLSARFRLLHQSSHLGDELLLGDDPPERVNLSVEVIDALLSYEWPKWRSYGGLSYLLRRDPDDLKRWGAQLGVEYRRPVGVLGANQLLGALDLESFEEVNWDTGTSLKMGLAYGKQAQGGNGIRVMLEAYDGPAPFGQFFNQDITYFAVGVYFDI